jgi:hypothetical protein
MLRQFTGMNVVGVEVTWVAPACDHTEITCVAAAIVHFNLSWPTSGTTDRLLPHHGHVGHVGALRPLEDLPRRRDAFAAVSRSRG